MANTRFLKIGWAAFLVLLGVMVAGGFQAPAEKNGVADINRLMDTSDYGKSIKDRIDKMKDARQGVLEFIDNNRVLTLEQATRIRDLSLKDAALTTEETAELASLKASVVAANKKWSELATKANMTPEERTLVQEYADRAQKMNELGSRWISDFTKEINIEIERQKISLNQRARTAIQEVAKAQGYSMVYDSVFTPYGANDVTDAALVAMNAKK